MTLLNGTLLPDPLPVATLDAQRSGRGTLMAYPLKKETDRSTWPTETIREASRKVSRTIDTLTDRLSKEIGAEVSKEEADRRSSDE